MKTVAPAPRETDDDAAPVLEPDDDEVETDDEADAVEDDDDDGADADVKAVLDEPLNN